MRPNRARSNRKQLWLLLTCALLSGSGHAQTLGFYAMGPVVRGEPYVAERIRKTTPPGSRDPATIEEIRSTVMRDAAGRLREQTEGTQPDQKGSFREAWVRVLDPVSMLQTDLDVSHNTYHQSPIPEQVKTYRQRTDACTGGPLFQSNPDGSTTHIRYEHMGRATVQGVPVDGCRITADDTAPNSSNVTEIWASPELQINLSSVTRYEDGREESDQVASLRREEPEGALFQLPADYIDMSAPPKRTNFNPNLDLLAEYGSIEWHEGMATLDAGGSDAASQVATTLRECLGLAVSSERPFQMYTGDLLDTTDPKWAAQHLDPSKRVFAGKPAKVHVDFQTRADGTASNPEDLLKAVVRELNAQQPYEVEVAMVMRPRFTMYALIPHATHDEQGHRIHPHPYMDTPITLPEQRTTIADLAMQMSNQMTQQTGNRFDCCQSFIAGVPWGEMEMQYRASKRPAREVLADLLEAEGTAEAYSATCEAHQHDFCFIDITAVRETPRTEGICKIPSYDPSK
jgi:hypothetical protein